LSYSFLAFLFLFVPLARAERIVLRPSSRDVDVRLLESGEESVTLEVLVGAFEKTPVLIEGKTYYRLSIRGESNIEERGAPDVPHVCRSVVIPDEGEMAVEVVSAEYEEVAGTPVAPSKGTLERTVDPATVPYEFGAAYVSGEWWFSRLRCVRRRGWCGCAREWWWWCVGWVPGGRTCSRRITGTG
jgi:hypothetical protein